jgi:N-dimethylarginine dimethylaminohydrolase
LYYPAAFTPNGRGMIHQHVAPDRRIEISSDDARLLAANAVCLGDSVVLSRCSSRLRERLQERGYRVASTPLDSFLRSGGSAFCLTLRLDRRPAAVDARRNAA